MSSVPGSVPGPEPGPSPRDLVMGTASLSPARFVQQRFQRWLQARLPLSDSIMLTQRNVYILPTRPGFMLGATLIVLLVGSINYQLNLGYLLTFLLAGSALVSMHLCQIDGCRRRLRLKDREVPA